MDIINDFLLLSWNKKQNYTDFNVSNIVANLKTEKEILSNQCVSDVCAILLSINKNSISKISNLDSFNEILKVYFNADSVNQEFILLCQIAIFDVLIDAGNKDLNLAIVKDLDKLRKADVISYDAAQKLINLLNALPLKKEVVQKEIKLKEVEVKENFYKNAIEKLTVSLDNIYELAENEQLKQKLLQIKARIFNQSFSIGITGVMNAGKSTMLNALLGKQLLGTSVVPETANLTLIKYSDTPKAIVNFWNAKEWGKIEESANSLKGMQAFIDETKSHFKDELSNFITPSGRQDEIDIDDLALYTSAKHSNKKCNLVKSVELYTDLSLVKDGVVIVDTPGLDDPVVQREEITLDYLSECDLMIHLMNAAQAATQKDVSFIIDALLYRRVARLLIVITRIDMIGEKELNEVIEYTKRSIKAQLEEQHKIVNLDELLAKLEFVPMAGKLALMHKIGQSMEANALGYPIERTGLPKIESYLSEVLFGENSEKAKLTINSNQKELLQLANIFKNSLEDEKRILELSDEERTSELKVLKNEKEAIESFVTRVKSLVDSSTDDLKRYFDTLFLFAGNKLISLRGIVVKRIIDDVRYEFEKNKKVPKEDRIAYMINSGVKDGIVDLVRDYRYEFEKKIVSHLDVIALQYQTFDMKQGIESVDVKAFLEENFKSLMIFKNAQILLNSVVGGISKFGAKELTKLQASLDELFAAEFDLIKDTLLEKLEILNNRLLGNFINICKEPLGELETTMAGKEQLLKQMMDSLVNDSGKKEQRVLEINKKLEFISQINQTLLLKDEK